MTTTQVPAVELRGLAKSFRTRTGTVEAVRGIELTVRRGEVLALLGPNGAGKTTLLDMMLGLTRPTAGTARILGAPPRRAVGDGRVAAVLQTGGLLRDLTVRETVVLVSSTFPAPIATDTVLERAGLTALADRLVVKCSGGEQQRIRFALALLPDPDVLVLDEPTSGMDVNARRDFWRAMHAEVAEGRTVVFATHYLEEADSFAERIVLVAEGRVAADGSTAEIRGRTSGRTVRATLAGPRTVREDAITSIRRLPGVVDVSMQGERVAVLSTDSDAVARAMLTEIGGTDLEIAAGSLDDAFVALTGPRHEELAR